MMSSSNIQTPSSQHNQSLNLNTSQSSLNQSFQHHQSQSGGIQFPLTLTHNLTFSNNQDYTVSIEASDERLTLMVEDRFDIHTWRGDFTSKYLEEITRKTGKERTYQMFMQMLVGTVQGLKGFSQFYIDLMGFQDLQLLKARRAGEQSDQNNSSMVKNNKKYLILTHLMNGQKVHYPLPLNPVETGAYLMDKDTMKRMVQRMSQTLNEFRNMGQSQQNQTQLSSNGFSQFSNNNNNIGRQTAKEFFSKENITHPVVEENLVLKKKLQQLEQAKQMGGAVSLNTLHVEKKKIENDFQSYQTITLKEIKKLKNLQMELMKRIDETKIEIQSERPQSAYSQLSMGGGNLMQNQTVTSNFHNHAAQNSMNAEVEELRRQLSEVSVELEETRDQYKKRMALQQKDMEEYYDQLSTFKQDEKQLRVKVNQLEVELEHNLKRLDIICKSKGLPRPQRKFSNASGASGTGAGRYVSPYGQRGGPSSNNGSATKPGGIRNLSNNSGTKRPSPLRNFQYTPPNKRNQSPGAYSQNSTGQNNKFRSSPMNNGYSNNTQTSLRNRQQSPGAKSIGSNKSTGSATKPTQNRLYSPSGRIRTNSGTQNTNNNTGLYGSGGNGVNRVRREPAVGGNTSNSNLNNSQNSFNSRSNSRTRVNSGLNNSGSGVVNNRSGSNNRNGSGVKSSGYGPATNKPSSTYQRKSSSNVGSSIYGRQNNNQNQNQNERKATLFSNNKSSSIYSSNQQKSSSSMILDQQKASQQNGTIDEKIEKLQNILKQAKQNL